MTADPVLALHYPAIAQAAAAALGRSEHRLPGEDVDVVITHDPFATIPELGIGGFSPNDHLMPVSIGPAHPNFREVMEAHLGRTLAHDLHHCARWRGPDHGRTL